MHKKNLLIFLFCLSRVQQLIADTEKTHTQRLEIIYAQYNDYQKVISNSPERDIILLKNHMTELQEEKNELNSFYNKTIKRTLYQLNAITFGTVALADIAYLILYYKDQYDYIRNYYNGSHNIYWLIETFKENRTFISLLTLFGTATGLLCKYCIKCASYPANRTKEINAAITRDQIIIAQLQKQIKLKENIA